MDKNDFGILRSILTVLSELTVKGLDVKGAFTVQQKARLTNMASRLHDETRYIEFVAVLDGTPDDLRSHLIKSLKELTVVPGTE
jgi:hypothetical protein